MGVSQEVVKIVDVDALYPAVSLHPRYSSRAMWTSIVTRADFAGWPPRPQKVGTLAPRVQSSSDAEGDSTESHGY